MASTSTGLSAYELKRLANIQEHEKLIASLGIPDAKQKLSPPKKSAKRGVKRRARSPLPERPKSKRIRGLDVNGDVLPEGDGTSSRPSSLSWDALAAKAQALQDTAPVVDMRQRPPATLELRATVEDEGDDLAIIQQLAASPSKKKKGKGARDAAKAQRDALARYATYSLKDNTWIKAVGQRAFSIAVHPAVDVSLTVVGDKYGHVGVCRGLETGRPTALNLKPHSRPVTAVTFPAVAPSHIISASYDGSLRLLDFRAESISELYSFDESLGVQITALDCAWDSPVCYIATNQGEVVVVDPRQGEGKGTVLNLHDRKVATVDVSRQNVHHLLTSCNDGTVCVWDVRKMKGSTSALSSLAHSRAVTSAYFCPTDESMVVTCCNDNVLRVWSDCLSKKEATVTRQVRHNNMTGRWITNFTAKWDPRGDAFFIGAMDRHVDVYGASTGHHRLTDDNLTAIPAVNAHHATRDLLFSATASGYVYCWQPSSA